MKIAYVKATRLDVIEVAVLINKMLIQVRPHFLQIIPLKSCD